MLNRIIIGISKALNAEFGMPIYKDVVKQGLDNPCFLITPVTVAETQLLDTLYERTYPIMVQYFPETHDYRKERNDVTERLLNALEYIRLDDDLIRGTDMTSDVHDEVLNFEVTYKLHIRKIAASNSESMEDLQADISVKE